MIKSTKSRMRRKQARWQCMRSLPRVISLATASLVKATSVTAKKSGR